MTPERPKVLFKYQPVSVRALTNLRESTLWFSGPRDFNDPFDCSSAIPARKSFAEYIASLERRNDGSAELVRGEILRGAETEESVATGFFESLLGIMKDALEQFVYPRGVACLSATSTDILMWAHYSNGHRGMCLEFDASLPPFSSAQAVRYTPTAPEIDPIALREKTMAPGALVETMMLFKHESWRYEQEWRVLGIRARWAAKYAPHALRAVHFGIEMPIAERRMVARLLAGTGTQLFQMQRDRLSFTLTSAKYSAESDAAV